MSDSIELFLLLHLGSDLDVARRRGLRSGRGGRRRRRRLLLTLLAAADEVELILVVEVHVRPQAVLVAVLRERVFGAIRQTWDKKCSLCLLINLYGTLSSAHPPVHPLADRAGDLRGGLAALPVVPADVDRQ